jgi:predicted ArsR family transcriptional regulator
MDRLDAIGDHDVRQALLFARARMRPVTANEVAAAHHVHRNVARARLERLVEAGLLIPSFERRTGRTGPGAGRPAKTYRVAPELSAIEFPERRYEELVSLLVEALPARGRATRLRAAGAAFGRVLMDEARIRPAKRLDTALLRVCNALGRAGYQASVAEVGGARGVISSSTCPLRPLVRTRPDLTALDRSMWSAMVERALDGAPLGAIECETHRCLDDSAECRIVVTRLINTA